MAFLGTWNWIQNNIQVGQFVNNWTRERGENVQNRIKIVGVSTENVKIDNDPNAKYPNEITVKKNDFQKVYDNWNEYINENIQRQDLKPDNFKTRYVLNILRFVEKENGGTLP